MPARGKATTVTVADAGQGELPGPMRRQRVRDRPDDVVARILPIQAHVVAQNGAAPYVDDDEQPDPLDLELLLEAQRIAHHDLEPHIQAMPVELDDVQSLGGDGRRAGR